MPLPPGLRIGAYEVIGLLGAGGMGEVYRAHDDRLKRDVAIKILPPLVAADPERLARFEREAQALAALNHPHIAQVFGLEHHGDMRAIVMELVDGPDLAELIGGGPRRAAPSEPASRGAAASGGGAPRAIEFDDVLRIARQIADALEAAHDKGIIHRDLKPANVKLTADGSAKVLDFGLAKAVDPSHGGSGGISDSPTLTARATQLGVILGTAAYMSPEQARGKTVDKRADIWAFGAVLFEMVTGRRAFDGDEMTDVLARVIERDPDWSLLPPATPPALRQLLERCLTKDPKSRLRDIGEARHALDALMAGRSGSTSGQAAFETIAPRNLPTTPAIAAAVERARGAVSWLPWALATGLAVVAAIGWFRPGAAASARGPRPTRAELGMPDNVEFYSSVRISPDGRRVAFIGNFEGTRRVYLRDLDQADARPVVGSETAVYVTFSPDSQSIATLGTDSRLKRISLSSGSVDDLVASVDIVGGLTWTRGNRLVFGEVTRLVSMSAAGGERKEITAIDTSAGDVSLAGPMPTPDGKTVLFTSWRGVQGVSRPKIEAVPIDGGARRVLLEDAGILAAVLEDRLVFQREAALYSAPFDASRVHVLGPATKILDDVRTNATLGAAADVTPGGDLLFAESNMFNGQLVWVSLDGRERTIPVAPHAYNNPRVSPDGRVVAYADTSSIWTADTERGAQTRVFNGGDGLTGFPVWSSDGRSIFLRSSSGIVRMRADGEGQPEQVPGTARNDYPTSVSSDGTQLVITRIMAATSGDILIVPVKGGEARSIVATPAYEGGSQLSPDGKWLAYVSNFSGRMEVYLRRLEGPERYPVSTSGGLGPLWSRDGHRIFFRNGSQFVAVDVETIPTVKLGVPKVLFERRYSFGQNITIANYSTSADGKDLLLVKAGGGHLTLILNWLQHVGK